MVTLIGFFFVLGNIILLELFDPDLVGTVRWSVEGERAFILIGW